MSCLPTVWRESEVATLTTSHSPRRAAGKKRILLMSRALTQGGSERQLAVTAGHLDRSRYEPFVGCMRPGGIREDELRRLGVPIESFSVRSFAAPGTLVEGLRLARFIRSNAIDLVHSFDVPMNIFAVPFARLALRPVVLSSARAHRLLTPGIYTKLLRLGDRMVDGVVVNCDAMRQHLINDEGVDPKKIHLCYNAIDSKQFHPADRRRPDEFPGEELVVGVVCGLRPEKNLGTLVEAFSRVCPNHPGLILALVGGGECLQSLRRQAETLGCSDAVVFVPETRDVPRFLRGIDIFVLPSLTEALSNSLMEAMACGCCPIASRVGGNPELVQHEKTGLLFEMAGINALAACIERLIVDPELRRRLAENAVRRIQRDFVLESSVKTMERIYQTYLE